MPDFATQELRMMKQLGFVVEADSKAAWRCFSIDLKTIAHRSFYGVFMSFEHAISAPGAGPEFYPSDQASGVFSPEASFTAVSAAAVSRSEASFVEASCAEVFFT